MLATAQIEEAFDEIRMYVGQIKRNPTQANMDKLKGSLNKFFDSEDSAECLGAIYTDNLDKLFFGVYVMPKIDANDVVKTITTDKRYRVNQYFIELDSKLFDNYLGLTNNEIAALILHDVNALVSTSAPSEEVVKSIDLYLADNHEALKLSDVVHYKEILSFGFRDALRKCTSIFEIGKHDKISDSTLIDILKNMNYENDIASAMDKINRAGYNFNREVDNKFITLSWVLRVYKDVLGYRVSALKTLERMQELSPSQIERKECNNFARRLNRIDDDMLLETVTPEFADEEKNSDLLNRIRDKYFSKYTTNFVDNLDIAKNDLVGIVLRQEKLEPNEPDAIPDLLNSINHSMMMIKDYAENNVDDADTYKQWDGIYQELAKRRDQITKEKMYDENRKLVNTFKRQQDQ